MRLSSLARKILPVLALSLLVMSCEDDPTGPGDSIIGVWRLVEQSIEVTIDGVLQPDFGETITAPDDIHFWQIFEITEDDLTSYQNDPCTTDFYSQTTGYNREGDAIHTSEGDTLQVSFDGDQLVFTIEYTETNEGATVAERMIIILAPYDGALPPTEWGTAISNDSYEPDDTYTDATAIATGSGNAQDHILLDGDADWFSLPVTSGTTYVIETTGFLDTYLRLYDTDGSSLITEDDDSGVGLNARIVWTAPADGTYYFSVRGYADSQCGRYSVSVVTQ
ncbi:MAG: PPC domain-containing protein [bacterium]